MAFIKSISELPSWFDLKKYETSIKKNNTESFLVQLIYRISLHRLINDKDWLIPVKMVARQYDDYTVYDFGCIPYILIDEYQEVKKEKITPHSEYWSHYQEILKYALGIIIDDPLLERGFGKLEESYHYSWIYCIRDTLSIFREYEIKPISDLSIYELGNMFTLLPQQMSQYLKFEFNEVHENIYHEAVAEHLDALNMSHYLKGFKQEKEDEHLNGISWGYINSLSEEDLMMFESMSQKKFLDYQRENTHTPPRYVQPTIKIDLRCSDSVLKEQFSIWLEQQRKDLFKLESKDELEINLSVRRTGESLINRIKSYRVIAYIDLKLWAALNEHKIKGSVLAHALYPNGAHDSEFIRKNLVPLVQKLFDPYSPEIAEIFAYKNMEELSY